ncbi:hypothetical protein D3C85_1730490 [compost metagenome]
MLHCIEPESINTHINILVIGVYQILINRRIFCVEVDAVSGNLSCLYGIRFPGKTFLRMVYVIVRLRRLH